MLTIVLQKTMRFGFLFFFIGIYLEHYFFKKFYYMVTSMKSQEKFFLFYNQSRNSWKSHRICSKIVSANLVFFYLTSGRRDSQQSRVERFVFEDGPRICSSSTPIFQHSICSFETYPSSTVEPRKVSQISLTKKWLQK